MSTFEELRNPLVTLFEPLISSADKSNAEIMVRSSMSQFVICVNSALHKASIEGKGVEGGGELIDSNL